MHWFGCSLRAARISCHCQEVQAEVEASPAAGEDEEKIVTIWAGSEKTG